jgi:hypothetical protein
LSRGLGQRACAIAQRQADGVPQWRVVVNSGGHGGGTTHASYKEVDDFIVDRADTCPLGHDNLLVVDTGLTDSIVYDDPTGVPNAEFGRAAQANYLAAITMSECSCRCLPTQQNCIRLFVRPFLRAFSFALALCLVKMRQGQSIPPCRADEKGRRCGNPVFGSCTCSHSRFRFTARQSRGGLLLA